MKYTAKLDYYATGEGRTLMILIGDYRNIDEVKETKQKIRETLINKNNVP